MLYTYECQKCGKKQDAYRKVADHKKGPKCCGVTSKQILTAAHVIPSFTPYRAVGLPGAPYIKTRSEHKAQLRRFGREEIGNDRSMMPEMEASDSEWQQHQSKRKEKIEAEISESHAALAKLGE